MGERVQVETLTPAGFAPFGVVIDTAGVEPRSINAGTTERFHALATCDAEHEGGRTILSVFRGQPRAFPYEIAMMERHPLGTQAFVPLQERAWLVIAAEDDEGAPGPPRVFLASGRQGVQYRRGVWHHPLMVLGAVSDFLVADREGPGDNLEESDYPVSFRIDTPNLTKGTS